MNRIRQSITAMVIALLAVSCKTGGSGTAEANYEVVPLPGEITMQDGTPFTLSGNTHIVYPEGNEKMQRNAEFLAEYLEVSTGIKSGVTTDTYDQNAVILSTGLNTENHTVPEQPRTENHWMG